MHNSRMKGGAIVVATKVILMTKDSTQVAPTSLIPKLYLLAKLSEYRKGITFRMYLAFPNFFFAFVSQARSTIYDHNLASHIARPI